LNFREIVDFLKHDIWRVRLDELPRKKSFLIKQLRIILLVVKGFDEDKCALRASALTFYSLLSIVPAVALLFGVAKGFGIQKLLENELFERFRGQEEVMIWIISFAQSMLENARGGLIAGVGVAFLLWFIIRLLGNIEKSFNEIWGVSEGRRISRKMTDYLAVVFICPILLVMASSITIFITTQITHITQKIDLLGAISPIIMFSLKALPYCVIWLLFTFIYLFMPNTNVHYRSAFIGGIIAGTIFQIVQWVYITFQIGVSKYGAIYGSFAALPLFLIWLQISWFIVLFGSEVTFAYQNVDTYEFEPDSMKVSYRFKKLILLRICQVCVRNFCDGKDALTAAEITNTLEAPIRLVNHILHELVQCRILSETKENSAGEPGYQPARDINSLSISVVSQAIDQLGSNHIPLPLSDEMHKIEKSLEKFEVCIEKSEGNLLIRDI
jgi:membrane protein